MTDDIEDVTLRDGPEANPMAPPSPIGGAEPPTLEPAPIPTGETELAGDFVNIKTPFGTVNDGDIEDAAKKAYHWFKGDSKKPPEPSGISIEIEDHEETTMHSTWVEHDDPPPPPPKDKPAQGSR
jgi:hypothetical protein